MMHSFKHRSSRVISGNLLILTCFSFTSVAKLEEIWVQAGTDVLLKCQAPRNSSIAVVKWYRPDLEKEGYVLFCRERCPSEAFQLPSYQGRVRLAEPSMKDGNMSIILSNTTVNDSGTYRCNISAEGPSRRRRAVSVFVTTIKLNVTLAGENKVGPKEGGNGAFKPELVAAYAVIGAVVIIVAGVCIYWKVTSEP